MLRSCLNAVIRCIARARSSAPCTLLLLGAILMGCPSQAVAQSDAYILRICNQGNVDVSIAMVRHRGGNLFGLLGGSHYAEGWWQVDRGKCEIVYDQVPGDGGWLAFTFAYPNAGWFALPVAPEGWGVLENRSQRTLYESDRSFCVADGRFSYDGYPDDLAQCRAGVADHYVIPFTVRFSRPVLTGGETTFTIRPDGNGPAWRIRPVTPAVPPPAKPVKPAPPLPAAPPRPVPKPLEPGTVNATLLETPVVRWSDEPRWYWYQGYSVDKTRPPVALWHDSGYSVPDWTARLGLQHFDHLSGHNPAMSTDSPAIRNALAKLPVGGAGTAVRFSNGGRLWSFRSNESAKAKAESIVSANIQSLQIEKAHFKIIQGVRFLEIPCKDPTCAVRVSVLAKPFASLLLATPETDLSVLIGALRELLAAVGPARYVTEVNAGCSCIRSDVPVR